MAKESQGKNGYIGHHEASIRLFTIKVQPSPKESNPCVFPLIWLRCARWYFWALAELKVSAIHCLLSGLNWLFELLTDTQTANARHVNCHLNKYKLPHSCKEGSSSQSPRNCSQRLYLISAPSSWWHGHSKTIILLRKTKSWNRRNPVGATRDAGSRG